MAFCGISRDKGLYGACFVLALCLSICEALEGIMWHFFSNHHCGCLYLGCVSSGRLRHLKASARDSTSCIVLLLLLPTPPGLSHLFRFLAAFVWCDGRTGGEHRSHTRQHEHHRIDTGIPLDQTGGEGL